MNYMVFDLEFNQSFDFMDKITERSNPNFPFEIIDIGGLKLDKDFNIISTFNKLVKPTLYKKLHPFVKRLTSISQDSLNMAKSFIEVYKLFCEFISDVNILCVWGELDIRELIRNIEYHNLDSSIIPRQYINVQHYATQYLNSPHGKNIGLGNAIRLMNIPTEHEYHKAFNDAYYTLEVLKKINNINIKPITYNHTSNVKPKRKYCPKTTLDKNALMSQFEKMLSRQISPEEQLIIELAYKMGHTNQFRL